MSQREYAYHKIRNAISYGELKPGERLVEKRLCEVFKLGRTPLREALSQLQIEGYLEFIPNRGMTITNLSVKNVKEIYNIIGILEGYATKMSTKYMNRNDIKKLKKIHDDLKKIAKRNNFKMYLEKNAFFHEYLVKASGNNFLVPMVNSLRNRIYRYRLIALTLTDSLEEYLKDHEKILKVISKKDASRAGKEMERHVLSIGKKFVKYLEKLPGV